MIRNLLRGDAKTIRAALKKTMVFASDMIRPDPFVIVAVRVRKHQLQVQNRLGLWYVPNEVWTNAEDSL